MPRITPVGNPESSTLEVEEIERPQCNCEQLCFFLIIFFSVFVSVCFILLGVFNFTHPVRE